MKKCEYCDYKAESLNNKFYDVDISNIGDKNCKDVIVCEECLEEVIKDWIEDNKEWCKENKYGVGEFKSDYVREIEIDIEDLDEECEEYINQMKEWEEDKRYQEWEYRRMVGF